MAKLRGDSNDPNVDAVFGEHTAGAAAIIGQSNNGRGMLGISEAGQGVWGASVSSYGVAGVSKNSAGVRGTSETGRGTEGVSTEVEGVVGSSTKGTGVLGQSDQGAGVYGQGPTGGFFEGGSTAGVHAVMLGDGPAILAKGGSGQLAARFEGNVQVTGDIQLTNGDCAEDFNIASVETVEPGTVMV